jgi:hypothetical protein
LITPGRTCQLSWQAAFFSLRVVGVGCVAPRAKTREPYSLTAESLVKYAERLNRWPKLQRFWSTLCSLVPTEADCERVFSTVKHVVDERRTSMSTKHANATTQVYMLSRVQLGTRPEPVADDAAIAVDDDAAPAAPAAPAAAAAAAPAAAAPAAGAEACFTVDIAVAILTPHVRDYGAQHRKIKQRSASSATSPRRIIRAAR